MKHLSQTRRPVPRTQSPICNKSRHRGAEWTRLDNAGGHRLGFVLKVSLCVSNRVSVTTERERVTETGQSLVQRKSTPVQRHPGRAGDSHKACLALSARPRPACGCDQTHPQSLTPGWCSDARRARHLVDLDSDSQTVHRHRHESQRLPWQMQCVVMRQGSAR